MSYNTKEKVTTYPCLDFALKEKEIFLPCKGILIQTEEGINIAAMLNMDYMCRSLLNIYPFPLYMYSSGVSMEMHVACQDMQQIYVACHAVHKIHL